MLVNFLQCTNNVKELNTHESHHWYLRSYVQSKIILYTKVHSPATHIVQLQHGSINIA